jgi:hypothetical protein
MGPGLLGARVRHKGAVPTGSFWALAACCTWHHCIRRTQVVGQDARSNSKLSERVDEWREQFRCDWVDQRRLNQALLRPVWTESKLCQ